MGNAVKVDFIGVGAVKSGTSWLFACLAEHPGLCMAEPKEINYFCEKAIWREFGVNNKLGPQWLAERFSHRKPGQRLGEFSPNYLCDPQSPRLILEHNPDCRLIFCFRHPVDALVSFYHQVRREAPVADTLEEFLQDRPEIPGVGLYHHHLQTFLRVVPRRQCLVLLFDDILRDPMAVMRETFSFVGVNPDFQPPSLHERINERKVPRSKALMTVIYWIKRRVHASNPRFQAFLWKLNHYRYHRWLTFRNLRDFASDPIAPQTRAHLLDFYRDDTRELARFLNRDLSGWEK